MEKIVALCKGRGFVYPGSEIYGGLSNSWDYGPLGVELKNNIKKVWWQKFVKESVFNVGIDSAILMNPQVWVASGHVVNFNDPLIDCKNCKMRYRADNLIEDWNHQNNIAASADSLTFDQLTAYIEEHNIPCPTCGAHNFTGIRKFNMMFKTHIGVTEDSSTEIYLRPETAQGMFVNFKNILRTTRRKLPFGICQIGKSFRNEITPGNFIFRIREFEQMELEFFCKPGEELQWFDYWRSYCKDWLTSLGVKEENLRMRDHEKEKLSHYSNATTDIEYLFPFGWGELWGIASRTNFDLHVHSEHSGEDLTYFDAETNEHYLPYCVEPSVGVDRLFLMAITEAYDEEVLDAEKNDMRVVLHLHPVLAPIKAAVLPLSKKLAEPAVKIYRELTRLFMVDYDETGSIGKRYRRQDEIGTPYCVTYDFESENDGCVTVRDRDTMSQVRIPIGAVADYIAKSQII
jgi:glycyl-tRNA synthetase